MPGPRSGVQIEMTSQRRTGDDQSLPLGRVIGGHMADGDLLTWVNRLACVRIEFTTANVNRWRRLDWRNWPWGWRHGR